MGCQDKTRQDDKDEDRPYFQQKRGRKLRQKQHQKKRQASKIGM